MKAFKNLSITAIALLLSMPAISGHHEEGADNPMKKNVMTAKKWVEASTHFLAVITFFFIGLSAPSS